MNRYYCIILNFEKLTPTAILLKVGIGQASLDKVKVSLAGKVVSSQSASALAALLLLEMILACVADNNTTAAGNLITLSGRLEQRKRNPVRTVFNIPTLRVFNLPPRRPSAHWMSRPTAAMGCCCCFWKATNLGAAAMPLTLEDRERAAAKGLGTCR